MKFNVIMVLDGGSEKEIGEMTAAEVKQFIEIMEMIPTVDEDNEVYEYSDSYFDINRKAFRINVNL